MKMKSFFTLSFMLLILLNLTAQENKRNFKIHTVAFYNLENLFDTINDVNKNDEASPIMEIRFNRGKIYREKVSNMAEVVSQIGYDVTKRPPSILLIEDGAIGAILNSSPASLTSSHSLLPCLWSLK